ncbi:hypothetical protein [Bhargavaea beijingensis]|uniref:Lipoprotein n=1 Tax=Bhargavaea beijingensis TaxID=426756 RepID=A0A1G7DW09_9BACL|nr:hypothetical protein [Bhargavaea beijingensis]MCW1928870.1 hypothetical protein [Bhargavaea beijingensis]RSK29951.1 hypothetical protein EJA12_10300 [Bhargavaea beijingensis]SDE55643.1 hypothetical protein SAMN04488126_111102 [Bhargavaea beijingensis]
MLKKAAPALFATAVMLAGCTGNEDALPADNETPMEDIRDGNDEMFDGNGNRNGDGNGMGGEGTNGPVDPDGTGPGFGEFGNDDGGGTDVNERKEIMEDDLDRNGNGGAMSGGQ